MNEINILVNVKIFIKIVKNGVVNCSIFAIKVISKIQTKIWLSIIILSSLSHQETDSHNHS